MEEEMADIEAQNEKQPEVAAIFKKANSAIALKVGLIYKNLNFFFLSISLVQFLF
jgi:hypothetical protein